MLERKELKIFGTTRLEIRLEVVAAFLEEKAGKGREDLTSRYIYFVEDIHDGRRVYLKRPAALNKGFDFTVHVENTNFGTNRSTTLPSHSSIISDLSNKQQEKQKEFAKVKTLIDDIFNCQPVDDEEIRCLKFESGHHIEVILKSIKWLFIEQDITYWNWSGRNMLYNHLKTI